MLELPGGKAQPVDQESDSESTFPIDDIYFDTIQAKTQDLVLDLLIKRYPGKQFEEAVMHVLTAMGYKVLRKPLPAADGGVDLIVAPDVFGFSLPRINVQVKCQDSPRG